MGIRTTFKKTQLRPDIVILYITKAECFISKEHCRLLDHRTTSAGGRNLCCWSFGQASLFFLLSHGQYWPRRQSENFGQSCTSKGKLPVFGVAEHLRVYHTFLSIPMITTSQFVSEFLDRCLQSPFRRASVGQVRVKMQKRAVWLFRAQRIHNSIAYTGNVIR